MARFGVHVQVLLDDELFISREIRHGCALTIGPNPRCTIPTEALNESITLLEPCRGGYGLHLAPPLSGQVSVGGRRLRLARGLLLDPRPEPLLFSGDDCGVLRLDEHLKLRFVIQRHHSLFRVRFPRERRLPLSLAASSAMAALLVLATAQVPPPAQPPQLTRLKTRPARLLIPPPSPAPRAEATAPSGPRHAPAAPKVISSQSRRRRLEASGLLGLVQQPNRIQRRQRVGLEQAMAALDATLAAVVPQGDTGGVASDPVIDSMSQVLTSAALPDMSRLRLPRARARVAPRLAPRPGGGPTREQIRQIVASGGGPIQHCYERELISSATAKEGRVVFRWVIDSAGKATKISVVKSTIKLPALQRCIRRQIQTWVFQPCPEGCTVVYPFEFFTRV